MADGRDECQKTLFRKVHGLTDGVPREEKYTRAAIFKNGINNGFKTNKTGRYEKRKEICLVKIFGTNLTNHVKFHQPHKIKGSLQFIGEIRAVLCDTTVLNYNREIVGIVEVFGKGRVDREASKVRILTSRNC